MEPKRTVIDYAALQAAVDQHKAEQNTAAAERLKAIRDNGKWGREVITALAKKAAEKDRAAKYAAAQREAERAAERAKQDIIGQYEKETRQSAVDEAYRTLTKQLR